jgi:hypothetical protein
LEEIDQELKALEEKKEGKKASLASLRDQINNALKVKAENDKALTLHINDSLLKRSHKEPQEESDYI